MGIGISSISLSKNTVLATVQLVVNVSLAAWLYNEYVHNPFMQTYVSSVWATIFPGVAVAVGVAVGVSGVLVFYSRRRLGTILGEESAVGATTSLAGTASLAALDVCPFCDTPLKTISEGRLQCRACRRYFKSSMPKIAA